MAGHLFAVSSAADETMKSVFKSETTKQGKLWTERIEQLPDAQIKEFLLCKLALDTTVCASQLTPVTKVSDTFQQKNIPLEFLQLPFQLP